MKLENLFNAKINHLIDKMASFGHRRYLAPDLEFRLSKKGKTPLRLEYIPEENQAIFFINLSAFSTMLPATRKHCTKNIIIDLIQSIYYNSRANSVERQFIVYLWEK